MPPASAAPFHFSLPKFLPLAVCNHRAVCLLLYLDAESIKAALGEAYSSIFNLTTQCVWNLPKHSQFSSLWAFSAWFFTFNPQILSLISLFLFTWVCQVGIGKVAKCCRASRCKYLLQEERGLCTKSKDAGEVIINIRVREGSLDSFISYKGCKWCRDP